MSAEAVIVADIRALCASGMTLEKIAAGLTERGVQTRTGRSTAWTHQAVARIAARLP